MQSGTGFDESGRSSGPWMAGIGFFYSNGFGAASQEGRGREWRFFRAEKKFEKPQENVQEQD